MNEWISCAETPIDFDTVAFILTAEGNVKPFRNDVGIFEHEQALWDILTCTHWMKKPPPPHE